MKRLALATLAALVLAPAVSHASNLNYTNLDAGYLRVKPDGFSSENGFGLRASAALATNWHVFGRYDRVSVDQLGAEFDLNQLGLGVGYNLAISDRTDFVARLSYERFDSDFVDDNGFGLEAGLRGAVTDQFELFGAVRYLNADGNTTSLLLGGEFKFTPNISVLLDADISDDGSAIFIGPRINF